MVKTNHQISLSFLCRVDVAGRRTLRSFFNGVVRLHVTTISFDFFFCFFVIAEFTPRGVRYIGRFLVNNQQLINGTQIKP